MRDFLKSLGLMANLSRIPKSYLFLELTLMERLGNQEDFLDTQKAWSGCDQQNTRTGTLF